jgi:hypothetical protein
MRMAVAQEFACASGKEKKPSRALAKINSFKQDKAAAESQREPRTDHPALEFECRGPEAGAQSRPTAPRI